MGGFIRIFGREYPFVIRSLGIANHNIPGFQNPYTRYRNSFGKVLF